MKRIIGKLRGMRGETRRHAKQSFNKYVDKSRPQKGRRETVDPGQGMLRTAIGVGALTAASAFTGNMITTAVDTEQDTVRSAAIHSVGERFFLPSDISRTTTGVSDAVSIAAIGGAGGLGVGIGATLFTGVDNPDTKLPYEITGKESHRARFGKATANRFARWKQRGSAIRWMGAAGMGAMATGLFVNTLSSMADEVRAAGVPGQHAGRQAPTEPRARSRRGQPTAAGVQSFAGNPQGSMVLDLHTTGGRGGVMT